MAAAVDVVVERESANDAEATVVEIVCASGTTVSAGQHILTIETSKATQEIVAPAGGVLVHALAVGAVIELGGAIARIGGAATTADHVAGPVQSAAVASTRKGAARLSLTAAELAASRGLSAVDFDGGLVTVADVERRLGMAPRGVPRGNNALPRPPLRTAHAQPNVTASEPHKLSEARTLGRGAGNSWLSVLGIDLAVGPFRRPGAGMFESKILDLVASEAARLMGDFKKLNAAHRDGGIEYFPQVTAGVAFDGMGRLVVYGIEKAATLSLAEMQDEIVNGLRKYAGGTLTARELTRATFTITDLTTSPISSVLPLLPEGQSLIIAIARGNYGDHRLFAGYDHRVSEGLEVGRFLEALRDAIAGQIRGQAAIAAECGFCGTAFSTAAGTFPAKGLLRVMAPDGSEQLCCRSCWLA